MVEEARAVGMAGTAFRYPLRRYQQAAVDAFEQARQAGRERFYAVLPPGAGKTALGLEVARRLDRRTLILCPNTAVQGQWLRQWQDFTPPLVPAGASTDLSTPITALTYQSLCVLGGEESLEEQARDLWAGALQAEQGYTDEQARAEIQALGAAGNPQYRAELARFRRRARTLVAQGGARADLLGLLHPNGRAIIERMAAGGPWTLIFDECHHLLEMWGYLVRALVEELGADAFVVGLTATPPDDMDARESALYRDIFGQADIEVPVPALVKEGNLAPYQELVYLTTPLPHEADYIVSQHVRFQELLSRLMEPDFASTPFFAWLRARVEERAGRDGARVSWARFARDQPRLSQAALRLLHQWDKPPPEGARYTERDRRPLTADDWVALIEDYCLRCLRASADPRDVAAWEEIRQALPSLGYVLTRRGVRAYVSPVDRVLSLSASKAAAALSILAAEEADLGGQLRALVLCDYERAGGDLLARLRGVLDPQAGSAALLLHLFAGDATVAALDPILLTGRTVACSRATAVDLTRWIGAQVPELAGLLATEQLFTASDGQPDPQWQDVVVIRPSGGWWQPRRYVPLLTRYFEEGHSRCLIGTRSLLGEGWDARQVNVLIDLTTAGTKTAVHQMRGRSLRLDPDLPGKVADNWDVVCVAPEHPKGQADYARFVRKHHRYYAATSEGEIESGVSHVHPDLSPYGPPEADEFGVINAAMLARASQRPVAAARWRIGEPYEGREMPTVRVRFGHAPGVSGGRLLTPGARAGAGALSRFGRRFGRLLAGSAVAGVGVAAVGPDLAGLAVGLAGAAGGGAWLLRDLRDAVRGLGPSDALEDIAAAVVEGLRETDGIAAGLGPESVRVVPQADGYYRCYLAGATLADNARFTEALDEALAPLAAPRYIVPRYIAGAPGSTLGAAALALRLAWRGRRGRAVVYHAVPGYLAAKRERADRFARAWNRYVSAGQPLYWKDPQAAAIIAAQRGADPFDITTQMRTLWE